MKKIYLRPQTETIALHAEERFMTCSPNEAYDETGNGVQLNHRKKYDDDFDDDAFDDEYAE